MARNAQMNAALREQRKQQILDAALSVYVRCGFHGTDMDVVAEEAGLAKGLLYYYFKTKRALFQELFDWASDAVAKTYEGFMQEAQDASASAQLVCFTWAIFGHARFDQRFIQFAMRLPFDAAAVFEQEQWVQGQKRSQVQMKLIAAAIQKGIAQGEIPVVDVMFAANSFWSVFVSNLFHFTKMIENSHVQDALCTQQGQTDAFMKIARFCFQGLGVNNQDWEPMALQLAQEEIMKRSEHYEGV